MAAPHFRLLVFDWDGTLLDSVGTIVACVQATLAALGEEAAPEAHIRAAIGLGLRETVETFRPGCDDALFERIVTLYRDLWSNRFADRSRLFPGVRELLESLRRRGHLLAVATAKSRGGLRYDLDRTGLRDLFDGTRTISESPSKPHPGMLLSLIGEFGVDAETCLMIGDSVHDLAMAARARVPAVAVCSGCSQRESFVPFAPLTYLASVTDLEAWLKAPRNDGGT